MEIILVDNNSTDGSIEFLESNYPEIKIKKLEKNYGFAYPSNLGAKMASGDFLLFLNNDTIVTKDFITELITIIEKDEKIAICQSLLLNPDGKIDSSGDFIDHLGVVYNSKVVTDKVREISSARGASMLIRKNVFDELEGFDEKFFVSFEDVDIGWRAWIKGYKVVLAPKSIVYHMGGKTIEKIKSEIAFHGYKNQLSMKITNFEPRLAIKKILLFFTMYGIHELKIWLDYTFKGTTSKSSTIYEQNIAQKPPFKVIFKSICWIIKNSSYLYKKQNHVNSSRILSTNDLEKMGIISNFKQ